MVRKRIIFLEAVQNLGGARISTLELAERLSADFEVLIVDFYGCCRPFLDLAKAKKLGVEVVVPRSEPYLVRRNSNNPIVSLTGLFSFLIHWIKLRSRIKDIIDDFDPDFLIVNNVKTLSTLGIRKRKYKTVYFSRGWFLKNTIPRFNRVIIKKMVDRFACVSEATKHAIFSGGFAKLEDIYVVHNAIDESSLPFDVAPVKNKSLLIMQAGGFLFEKGQHISVEIGIELKRRGIEFQLLLAGVVYKGNASKRYHAKIVDLINDNDLNSNIIIITDQNNVLPYFRACDIIIHPSATEGLPRVLMEAMILKKPVIANAVGGVIDYILSGYTGYITRFNNVDDYVDYILDLAKDREKYNFISENAYNLIRTSFTEVEQIKQFKKLLL